MKAPLVSCICPTANRRRYIPQMLESFRSQSWENKELIILDDGEDSIEDLIPEDPRIRYERLEQRINIPRKRNLCVQLARGSVIIHFDDDDWSAPGRIAAQLHHLKQFSIGITGFHSILFWEERSRKLWKYFGSRGYACGTSFAYLKAFWRRYPFPEGVDLGSDNCVIYGARSRNAAITHDGGQLVVARIHGEQSNRKNLNGQNYRAMPPDALPAGFPKT